MFLKLNFTTSPFTNSQRTDNMIFIIIFSKKKVKEEAQLKLKKNKIKSISIADASLVAGKDRMTIYRWIKAKKINARKDRAGYRWVIILKSLKNYIAVKGKGGEKIGYKKRVRNRKPGISRRK